MTEVHPTLVIVAEFDDSVCRKCGTLVVKGDLVWWARGYGVVHKKCPIKGWLTLHPFELNGKFYDHRGMETGSCGEEVIQ
jgi:hypothetical protein